MDWVWTFHGDGATLCSAVFSTKENADVWIAANLVSGILTLMPLDEGIYQWAIINEYFAPKKDYQKTGAFVQKFTSAYLEHYHYVDGVIKN